MDEPHVEESSMREDGTRPSRNAHVLNCVKTSGHHVFEEETICPLGGEKFNALYLGTHSYYGVHLDLEPDSYMRFPVPIPVCPSNGFVMAEPEYTDTRLEILKSVVESTEYRELFKNRHATYYLLVKFLELSGVEPTDQWWLYLNASWEADLCGDKSRYREYTNLVITKSLEKLQTLTPSDEDYWTLRVLVSNAYRRIGDFEKASEYFAKIGVPELENSETNEFYLLAKKLLAEAIANRSTERVAVQKEE